MCGIIIKEANSAIFCILPRVISKDVCSVIIAGKRQIFATLPKMYWLNQNNLSLFVIQSVENQIILKTRDRLIKNPRQKVWVDTFSRIE